MPPRYLKCFLPIFSSVLRHMEKTSKHQFFSSEVLSLLWRILTPPKKNSLIPLSSLHELSVCTCTHTHTRTNRHVYTSTYHIYAACVEHTHMYVAMIYSVHILLSLYGYPLLHWLHWLCTFATSLDWKRQDHQQCLTCLCYCSGLPSTWKREEGRNWGGGEGVETGGGRKRSLVGLLKSVQRLRRGFGKMRNAGSPRRLWNAIWGRVLSLLLSRGH